MAERAEKLPNWHHTLYYKRNFQQFSYTYEWREHPVMIVPMPYWDHVDLHNAVRPVDGLPSRELACYALSQCVSIQSQPGTLTHLEAFTSVRDELAQYHRLNKRSYLGKEALKFSEQFSRQIEYMSEVPGLGSEWTAGWMQEREQRVKQRLLDLRLRELGY